MSESLGNMSLIDHVCMSNNLKNHPISLKLIDFRANLSDHKPLTFLLSVINLNGPSEEVASAAPDRLKPGALFSVRWDKCDKFVYCRASRDCLSRVELPVCSCTESGVCPNTEHCSVKQNCTMIL